MIDDPAGRYRTGPIRTPVGGAVEPAPPALIAVPLADLCALLAWAGGTAEFPAGAIPRLWAPIRAAAEGDRRDNLEDC